jgi:glc operon protein GlcG
MTEMAFAQIENFVIRGPAAAAIHEKNALSLDTAKKIAAACEAFARQRNITVSIFILDQFGNFVFAERMDGQRGILQIGTALKMAQTVIITHQPSHALLNRVLRGNTTEFHQGFYHGAFPQSGGLPIIYDNQFLGAIGVGGSGEDEECARAGLEAVFGPQPPLTETLVPSTDGLAGGAGTLRVP